MTRYRKAVTIEFVKRFLSSQGVSFLPYIPKPKPSFLDGMEKYKVIDGRQTYRTKRPLFPVGRTDGEIEAYDKRGWHLGALDAKTGELIKEAERGRRIHV